MKILEQVTDVDYISPKIINKINVDNDINDSVGWMEYNRHGIEIKFVQSGNIIIIIILIIIIIIVTNSRKNRIERIQYNSKDDNMCGGDLYFSDDVDQKKIKIGGVFCINEISKQRIVVVFKLIIIFYLLIKSSMHNLIIYNNDIIIKYINIIYIFKKKK